MDFDLPNEVKIVKRTTREFAEQVIAPLVDEMEMTGELPRHLIKEMGDLGLLGLITPEEYGGSNLGYVARTAVIPAQDLLGLGEEARMNHPARSKGNWTWRLTPDQLEALPLDKLRSLTKLAGRL